MCRFSSTLQTPKWTSCEVGEVPFSNILLSHLYVVTSTARFKPGDRLRDFHRILGDQPRDKEEDQDSASNFDAAGEVSWCAT
jgi:hypothetical protein